MTTLLKIDVSTRGDSSVSRKLGEQFVTQWKESHTGGNVVSRDLTTTELPFVTLPWILAAYSPVDGHTPEQKSAIDVSDRLVDEMQNSDHYLISTPMYNFAIPAILKAWIDHVVRAGKTFKTNPDGSYTGLLTGKKATVLLASAGVYEPGTPAEGYNFLSPYLRHILGFMGVSDVTFVEVGATYTVDRKMATLESITDAAAPAVIAAAR
jgi:FMN-dependent NADH-azoreductase